MKEEEVKPLLKKIVRYIPFLVIPVVMLVLPLAVSAQPAPPAGGATDIVPQDTLGKVSDIRNVIRGIIQFILVVAFVIAFIMLIVGGVRWILAGGDEKSVEKARNTITAALIGLVIVLVAYALIRLVEIFFGFSIISGGVTIPTINTQ